MERIAAPADQKRLNLWVDLGSLVLMVYLSAPRASGIPLHEWISILFLAPFLAHLLLHWRWIEKVSFRFFRGTSGMARFNYVLNALLFICMIVVMLSGVLISRAFLPALGIPISPDRFWSGVHDASANLLLLLLGVHLGLHWDWLNRTTKQVLLPFGNRSSGGARS